MRTFLTCLLALSPVLAQVAPVALTGGTVIVGDGRILTNATVIMRGGRIEAIGSGLAVPAGATVIDARGLNLYPGLIDALTEQGYKGPAKPPDGPMFSATQASASLDLDAKTIAAWRDAGITTLHISPNKGVIRGQTAVVNLTGAPPANSVVRAPAAMAVFLQGLGFRNRRPGMGEPGGEFPTRLIGVPAFLRQTFLDVRRFDEMSRANTAKPDAALEAMVPVARGTLPLILPGKEEREIRRAVGWAQEWQVNPIIAGGYEGNEVAALLKQKSVPALIALNYPAREKDVHPDFNEPARLLEYRRHAPRAAGELAAAGIKIAFYSDGLKSGADFVGNLRLAVAAGLPKAAAIRAATLSAAEILGVEKQLGSIEPQKIANLIVTEGDLFDGNARIRHVFVEGNRFDPTSAHQFRAIAPIPPPAPHPTPAAPPREILFKNATVMTVSHGTIKGGSILVRDGKIARVAKSIDAPAGAQVIDATGKWITPGFIDCHSHIATDSHNEATSNQTSMANIADVLNNTEIAIYRELAAGVTTANTLHGSVNPIGGQTAVIKFRWGKTVPEMMFEGAPKSMKFAVKEFGRRQGISPPSTFMGVETLYRNAFNEARKYAKDWDDYRARKSGIPPRRDLRIEPLVEVLKGERMIHVHVYEQNGILMFIRLADEYGFKIANFHHATEAFKAADEIAKHGAGVSIFSTMLDANPYNAAILTRKGVTVSINSDGESIARYLNQQAAMTTKYGLNEDEALSLITLNPAKQMRIDNKVGSIDEGKDADLVIFDRYPLSILASPVSVYIDGQEYFSREKERARLAAAAATKNALEGKSHAR